MSDNDPSAGAMPVAGGATPPQTQPATTTPAAPAPTAAPSAPATGDPDALGDAGKQALDRMKAERNAERDRAKKAEDELEQLRSASKSETEKAIDAAKKTGASEVQARYEAQIRRSEVKAALAAQGVNPQLLELAPRADHFAALKVTEDGSVEGIDEAIKAFKAAAPDAFKAPGVGAPAGPSGSADGGVRGAGKTLTRDQLKGMTPAQINEAFDKGQLDPLLKRT